MSGTKTAKTTLYDGLDMSEWRAMPWWPEGREATVIGGVAGHDDEIVVNIDGYGYFHSGENPIPGPVWHVFRDLLPESWKAESRGSRIEVHPSGHFAGGYAPEDLTVCKLALEQMGLDVTEVSDRGSAAC